MEFIKEFWEFLKIRKKYWLLPIIFVLVLFGGLIILMGICCSTIYIHFFNVITILGISAFIMIKAAILTMVKLLLQHKKKDYEDKHDSITPEML